MNDHPQQTYRIERTFLNVLLGIFMKNRVFGPAITAWVRWDGKWLGSAERITLWGGSVRHGRPLTVRWHQVHRMLTTTPRGTLHNGRPTSVRYIQVQWRPRLQRQYNPNYRIASSSFKLRVGPRAIVDPEVPRSSAKTVQMTALGDHYW